MKSRAESTSYVFDGFRVEAGKRLLFDRDDQPVPLTPKVFDTLFYLLRNTGKVIEKDELMSAIWPDTVVEENNLNRNISTLRRMLGENRGEHRFIVTVPGTGYKFVAEVDEVVDGTPFVEPVTGIQAAAAREEPVRGKRFWLMVTVAALLIGASLIVLYTGSSAPEGPNISSVAVLPFVNASGDPEMDYLSEGLSENLIDRLSELPQLKVIARSSSAKYRDENVDLREIAGKLNVQAIVTGRLMRRGDELTIRVELVDADNDKQLWGGQFTRPAAEVQVLQTEIARTISSKLRLKLSGEQDRQLGRKATDNPKAYDLVLEGDFLARRSSTRVRALEQYKKAIAADPNYALAYARLAGTYQSLASAGVFDPTEVSPDVETAANKAIELDGELADAHLVLANIARNNWDWGTAEREYERALKLSPNLAEAHRRYSSFLSDIGRHDQALAEAVRVRELDPGQSMSYLAAPTALALARRFDESILELKKVLDVEPIYGGYGILGTSYIGKGMYREAVTAYEEAVRVGGKEPYLRICLGAAYAGSGDRKKALEILNQLETSGEYLSPGELPILYGALGDREKAFALLDKAYATRDQQLQHLNADAGFDPLRDDPRFQDLLRRIGLPDRPARGQ